MSYKETLHWLMQGDPAIRWQVMRDLLNKPAAQWKPEQAKVATEGWGKKLLDFRDPAGTWAGGIYTPKWTSTTYTLLLLRDMGIPRNTPACHHAAAQILNGKITPETWENLDLCISGMYLALLTYFNVHNNQTENIVHQLLKQQLPDGGWNCQQRKRTVHHSSLHTTINVLDGLTDYAELHRKKNTKVAKPIAHAHEFILQHRLFKSDKTNQIIHPTFTKLAFPPRWHWDILRGLTLLRRLNIRDNRMQDAIDLLRSKRLPTGQWKLEHHFKGKEFFKLEKLNQPSRWNTLRAMRVLQWWDRPMALKLEPQSATR
ncbi:MAG: hypothetical protein FWD53_08880 [Phycisphaerales bacterium]|nr:hypothetical protein [Phycisphaerales bacterium]